MMTPPQQQESEEEMAAKYADQIPEGYAVTACEVEVAALWGLRKGKELGAFEFRDTLTRMSSNDIASIRKSHAAQLASANAEREEMRKHIASLDTAAQETAKDYHALEVERDELIKKCGAILGERTRASESLELYKLALEKALGEAGEFCDGMLSTIPDSFAFAPARALITEQKRRLGSVLGK